MLDILIIVLIGNWYRSLAKEYNKPTIGYAILGVAVCYITAVVGVFLVAFVLTATGTYYFEDDASAILLALTGLPFGILAAWLVRRGLKSSWERKRKTNHELIDDSTEF